MKFNLKVLIALVVLVGAGIWGVDSVRTRSYSGTDLNLAVGTGLVTVANPSDASLPVQLLGTGNRSFSVSSVSDSVAGSSTRQGSGRNTQQLFEFELPPGITEMTIITRGSDVSFVADTAATLSVSMQPLTASDTQTTIIIAAIAILGSLFFMSRTTGHQWLSRFRPVNAPAPELQPIAVPATEDPNRGRDGRMYTDA